MSIDYIMAMPEVDAVWDEDPESPSFNPSPSGAEMARYNSKVAYLTPTTEGWPVSAYIVGAWDSVTGLQAGQSYDYGTEEVPNDPPLVVGSPTHPVLPEYATDIAGMSNDSGMATGEKDTLRYQGHSERKFVEDDKPYPTGNEPFTLKITRQYIDDDGFPQIPWGWRVDMISADPARDITARAVGIYSDPECTSYLYTTGAFVDDGNGNYYTVCPVGQRKATAEPVYFALLLGAGQEGYFNLIDEAEGAEVTKLFWAT